VAEPGDLLAEVHHQVASLLGGPFSGWMQYDSENADAPGGVLYHGQDICPGAVEQVGGEEVARQALKALHGASLRYIPEPATGYVRQVGYVVSFPDGNLAFATSQGIVTGISGGPDITRATPR